MSNTDLFIGSSDRAVAIMRKLLSILAALTAAQFLDAEDINISTENAKLVLESDVDGLLTLRGCGMACGEFAPIKRTDELVR